MTQLYSWLLDSLKGRVKDDIEEWMSANPVMRRESYRGLEKSLSDCSCRPIASALAIAIVLFAALVLQTDAVHTATRMWRWPEILVYDTWSDKAGADSLFPFFLSLWAIQATIAVLVYPVVLAFVAVLFQRISTPTAIRVYLHYTGAKFAGISALSLIFFMLLQFVLIAGREGWITARELGWWCVFDAMWLALNLSLTGVFLFRTINFLNPARRYKETVRYALTIVWRGQVNDGIGRMLFQGAGQFGVLPIEEEGHDPDDKRPVVRLHSWFREDEKPEVTIEVGRERRLVDVYFRLLRVIIRRWTERARQSLATIPSADIAISPRPVLRFPVAPGEVCNGNVTLVEREGNIPLTRLERTIARYAFKFEYLVIDLDDRVESYLRELLHEGVLYLNASNEDAFREVVDAAVTLHSHLLAGSEYEGDDSRSYSYAMLESREGWSRQFHEDWIWSYKDALTHSINRLEVQSDYFETLCYVPARLVYPLIDAKATRPRERAIDLGAMLFFQLSRWWQRHVDAQEVADRGICAAAQLKPPLFGVHRRALIGWIGAWESLRDNYFGPVSKVDQDWWLQAQAWVESYVIHLNQTAELLVSAVLEGDKLGAECLADCLQKWSGGLGSKFQERGFGLRRGHLITVNTLTAPWHDVQEEYVEDHARDERMQEEVYLTALTNYWVDVRCVVLYQLALWSQHCNCDSSLAAQIIRGLLSGQSWLEGADRQQAEEVTAPWLFRQFVRQAFASDKDGHFYELRLDAVVGKFARLAEKDWVSGRVHSRTGADDLPSLLDGILVLMASQTDEHWSAIGEIESDVRTWMADDARLRAVQERLRRMETRLASPDFGRLAPLFECLRRGRHIERTFENARAQLASIIGEVSTSLGALRADRLRDARVDQERVGAFAEYASRLAFSADTGTFPLGLFRQIRVVPNAGGNEKRLNIRGLEKGRFTRPEMAQRVSNEQEWVASAMRGHVGAMLLAEALSRSETEVRETPTPQTYWAALKQVAAELSQSGRTPILLLDNATRPRWAWDWMRENYGRPDFNERPEDLVFSKSDDARIDGYLGHFNDIAVYVAPLSHGVSIVTARESFAEAIFNRYESGLPVEACWAAGASPVLIDISLAWRIRLRGEDMRVVKLLYSVKKSKVAPDA